MSLLLGNGFSRAGFVVNNQLGNRRRLRISAYCIELNSKSILFNVCQEKHLFAGIDCCLYHILSQFTTTFPVRKILANNKTTKDTVACGLLLKSNEKLCLVVQLVFASTRQQTTHWRQNRTFRAPAAIMNSAAPAPTAHNHFEHDFYVFSNASCGP